MEINTARDLINQLQVLYHNGHISDEEFFRFRNRVDIGRSEAEKVQREIALLGGQRHGSQGTSPALLPPSGLRTSGQRGGDPLIRNISTMAKVLRWSSVVLVFLGILAGFFIAVSQDSSGSHESVVQGLSLIFGSIFFGIPLYVLGGYVEIRLRKDA